MPNKRTTYRPAAHASEASARKASHTAGRPNAGALGGKGLASADAAPSSKGSAYTGATPGGKGSARAGAAPGGVGSGRTSAAQPRGLRAGSASPTRATGSASTTRATGSARPSAGAQLNFSRRALIGGAIGVGALALAGGGVGLAIRQAQENAASNFDTLDVASSHMTTNSELTQVEDPSQCVTQVGNFELELGTLVWVNDDEYATCLIPTEGANPLTQVGLLALSSGNLATVLSSAAGAAEKFEIFDVRGTSQALIWVEANILDGVWRVYSATTNGTTLTSSATIMEEQYTSDWETPTITIVGKKVFWQMQPQEDGPHDGENSVLKWADAGSSTSSTLWETRRTFGCAPYGGTDCVVIAPRQKDSNSYYQMTCLDAASGEVRDTCVLPGTYVPSHVGYGENGFMFCLDAIYNTSDGDGIGNLGTYTAKESTAAGADTNALNNMDWFAFARTPLVAPCWCKDYFMVKSTTAVCGINLRTDEYFVLDVDSGAEDYGEVLATEGARDTVVTYTNIDHTPLGGTQEQLCRVKVYKPVA